MGIDKCIKSNANTGFALDTDTKFGHEKSNIKSFRTLISENEQKNELELFENEHFQDTDNN